MLEVRNEQPAGAWGLPVAVALPPRLGDEVTRYVEGVLGWRRVPRQGPPRPRLVLAEAVDPRLPTVVVVDAQAPGQATAVSGALGVVHWPSERDLLAGCAAGLPAPVTSPAPPLLRVGGALPHGGASTVALAVAGLGAWAGRRTLVVGGEGLLRLAGAWPWRGPSAHDLARLSADEAAAEVDRLAVPARGVPGLLLLAGDPVPPAAAGWPVGLLVADVGLARPGDADVLAGWGPLAALPYSARVARAGTAGRVPAALPGSYLAALRRLLPWC